MPTRKLLQLVVCMVLACSRHRDQGPKTPVSSVPVPTACPAGSVRIEGQGPNLDCEEDKPGDRALHGPFVHHWPNHKKEEVGTRKRGLRDGDYQSWNEQGELLARGSYVEGLRQGPWVSWWSSAPKHEVRVEETFDKGVRVGEPRIVDQAGRTLAPIEASVVAAGRGRQEASLELKDQWGKAVLRGPLAAGARHGIWTSWFNSAQKAAEVSYENGVRSGSFRTFWPDGRPAAHGSYVRGTVKELWSDDLRQLDGEVTLKLETRSAITGITVACGALIVATKDQLYALGDGAQLLWERAGPPNGRIEPASFRTDSEPCLVRVVAPDAVTYLNPRDGTSVAAVAVGFDGSVAEVWARDKDGTLALLVGVQGDTLRACDIKSGECKLTWKAEAAITSPLVLHGDSQTGRLWFGDQRGTVYVLPCGGPTAEFGAKPVLRLNGAIREIALHRDDYGLFLQDAPKKRLRADCLYGVGAPMTMSESKGLKPLMLAGAKSIASVPQLGLIIDGQSVAWTTACFHDRSMAERGFEPTGDVHLIRVDGDNAAMLATAGTRPAVMRLAWVQSSIFDTMPVRGPWVLPDVLTCPGRVMMEHSGPLGERPLWFACRGSQHVYSVDLRQLVDAASPMPVNRVWTTDLPPGFNEPRGENANAQLADGIAYVSFDGERKICAIDVYSGATIFCRQRSRPGFEVVANGILVSLTEDHVLLAHNAVTGDPMWRYGDFDLPGAKQRNVGHNPVAQLFYAEGVVAVAHSERGDSELQGLDIRTGSPLYRTTIPQFPTSQAAATGNQDGTFYVHGRRVVLETGRGLRFLDLKTGKIEVSFDALSSATDGERLFFIRGDEIVATDFSGIVQWTANPCRQECLFGQEMGVANGIVWGKTRGPTAREYCVRAESGKPAPCRSRWQERSAGDDKLDFMGPYQTPTGKSAVDGWLALLPSQPASMSRSITGVDVRRSPGTEQLRPAPGEPARWKPRSAQGTDVTAPGAK